MVKIKEKTPFYAVFIENKKIHDPVDFKINYFKAFTVPAKLGINPAPIVWI